MPTTLRYLVTSDPSNGASNYPGYDGYFSHISVYVSSVEKNLVDNNLIHVVEIAGDFPDNTLTQNANISFQPFKTSANNTITIKPIDSFPFHAFVLDKAIKLKNIGTGWVKMLLVADKSVYIKDLAILDISNAGKCDAIDYGNDSTTKNKVTFDNCIIKGGRFAIEGQRYSITRNCILIVDDADATNPAAHKSNKWGSNLINCLLLAPNYGVGLDTETGGSNHKLINTLIDKHRGTTTPHADATNNATTDSNTYGPNAVTGVNLDDIFVAGSFDAALSSGDLRLKTDPSNPLFNAGNGVEGPHIGPTLAYVQTQTIKHLITADPNNGAANYPGYAGYFSDPIDYINTVDKDLVAADVNHVVEIAGDFPDNTLVLSALLPFVNFITDADHSITFKPIESWPFHNYIFDNAIKVVIDSWNATMFDCKDEHVSFVDLGMKYINTPNTKSQNVYFKNDWFLTDKFTLQRCMLYGGKYSIFGVQQGTISESVIINDTVGNVDGAAARPHRSGCKIYNSIVIGINGNDGINGNGGGWSGDYRNNYVSSWTNFTGAGNLSTNNAAPDANALGANPVLNVDTGAMFLAGSVEQAIATGDFRLRDDPSNPLQPTAIGPALAYADPDNLPYYALNLGGDKAQVSFKTIYYLFDGFAAVLEFEPNALDTDSEGRVIGGTGGDWWSIKISWDSSLGARGMSFFGAGTSTVRSTIPLTLGKHILTVKYISGELLFSVDNEPFIGDSLSAPRLSYLGHTSEAANVKLHDFVIYSGQDLSHRYTFNQSVGATIDDQVTDDIAELDPIYNATWQWFIAGYGTEPSLEPPEPPIVIGDVTTDITAASMTLQPLQVQTTVVYAPPAGNVVTSVTPSVITLQPLQITVITQIIGDVVTSVTPDVIAVTGLQVTTSVAELIKTTVTPDVITVTGLSVLSLVSQPGSGTGAPTAAFRVADVPRRSRIYRIAQAALGEVMAYENLIWKKQPDEILWFGFRWEHDLAESEITNSSWSANGLTIVDENYDATGTNVKLSGGELDQTYVITNTITTNDGQLLVHARRLLVTV